MECDSYSHSEGLGLQTEIHELTSIIAENLINNIVGLPRVCEDSDCQQINDDNDEVIPGAAELPIELGEVDSSFEDFQLERVDYFPVEGRPRSPSCYEYHPLPEY